MRLFQNTGLYPSYLPRLNSLARHASGFEGRRSVFLNDRFGALHFLKPVLDGDEDTFFTNGSDEILQRQWAQENGLKSQTPLEDILLAQIEHHRSEVFYNLDPMRFASAFVRKLPGCVRRSICWRAAPSGRADLTAYGAVLGNFPSILESWRREGCRAEWFAPAIDPVMDEYGASERPIDVLFIGGYSRHHSARAQALQEVANLSATRQIVFRLDASRLTRMAESALGRWLPLRKHRRPPNVAKIAGSPVFGRQLYELIGKSKIVLNGAIDMAGEDRGNMRCFEAMGCGALLVSDTGNYPDGMIENETMIIYRTAEDCAAQIERALADWPNMHKVAGVARSRMRQLYSKELQWISFENIVAKL
jgi:Glycosyl transferases group 1